MKVLLDQGVSKRIRPVLERKLCCEVHTVDHHGWGTLRDDELLQQAALLGFTTIVTTDLRMAEEQRQAAVAVVAVDDNRIPGLIRSADSIVRAIHAACAAHGVLVRTVEAGCRGN